MNTLAAIDQLYNDYITRLDGDSEESAAALRECRAELLKLKPRATRAEQNNADDAIFNYGSIERREGFIDGFRYAVKPMGEVYAAPESNQRGADT